MLTDKLFKDILSEYQVDSKLWDYFGNTLREPIERAINSYFSKKPHYQYGGSLAKGTANSNSCDVDLLVYFDDDFSMSVAEIYEGVASALYEAGYLFNKKNSAINVFGNGYEVWDDVSVDVVPGKYSSGGDDKDVCLHCNKDGSRLKSNPEKQIDKVKQSNVKQVIRLIKLLRQTHGFAFKSFFLELFAIDVVGANIKEGASLVEKVIQFAKQFDEIGVTKVYDPANPNGNNIMGIHNEYEFQIIRSYIKTLYEVLLTDNDELVKYYLTDEKSNDDIEQLIESSYEKSAKSHSPSLKLSVGYFGMPTLSLSCHIKGTGKTLLSGETIGKETYLRFEINKSSFYSGYDFKFIVSNAGFEARIANQPRGKAEEPDKELSNGNKYVKEEHTLYNGNHYVQVIATHPNKDNLYSIPFLVKVRDFLE